MRLGLLIILVSFKASSQSASEAASYNQKAAQIVQSNYSYIQRNYQGYSGGYSSQDQYYSKSTTEPIANFLNLLKDYREFRINVPSRHRMQILEEGYLNQHQTSSSSGCLCPDNRNAKEATMINWAKSDYAKLNNYIKPKYGSMGILGQKLNAANHYGDDVYILDENKISDRTTYTLTDSLGIGRSFFNGQSPIFVPTKFQELLLDKLIQGSSASAGNQIYANSYTEIQVWGVVQMQTLKEFRFTRTPPSEKLAEFFINNNIKIRQIVCSSSSVGDEGCLKDYETPTILRIESFLKQNKIAQAQKKLVEVVKSGYNLSLLHKRLNSKNQKWMWSIVKNIKDFKNQIPNNWLLYAKQLSSQNIVSVYSMYDLYAKYGDLKSLVDHLLSQNIAEEEFNITSMKKINSIPLNDEKIALIKSRYPNLTKLLRQHTKSILLKANKKELTKIPASSLIAFAPKSYETAVGRELLTRIKKGTNPYSFISKMDEALKKKFLSGIKQCIARFASCLKGSETSFGIVITAYIEGFSSKKISILKKYFSEVVSAHTFGKQGTLIDMIDAIRANQVSLDQFYLNISNTIIDLKYRVGISPYEVAIELTKDKDSISIETFNKLSQVLKDTPHPAIFFKENGMAGPVIPTYYHIEQVRNGKIRLPSIYPIDIFTKRMVERAKEDPNTQLYRLYLSNLPELFVRRRGSSDLLDTSFDEILKTAKAHYKYIILQSKSYASYKVNDKDDPLEKVKEKLYDWENLLQKDKDLFIKSLDVLPLYLLENNDDPSLLKAYLNEVSSYLNSEKFKKFKLSGQYKEWGTERESFPKNYYYGKVVSNKIEDFFEKFEQLSN